MFLDCNFFAFVTAEIHPAPDFSRHTLIKTRIYHGREKRQIQTTKEGVIRYTINKKVVLTIKTLF